ncbi:hypothetical protein BDB01DRAFT_713681 [Pilobolus umbonatus]|nr:hypothetical protein BDB01DRAFT_713681 [Pilobolus umbonatus]
MKTKEVKEKKVKEDKKPKEEKVKKTKDEKVKKTKEEKVKKTKEEKPTEDTKEKPKEEKKSKKDKVKKPKEEKEEDDNEDFVVLKEITEVDADESAKNEKKRRRKELSKEERELERKLNRESREKKKARKELNKKRKKGEIEIEDVEMTDAPVAAADKEGKPREPVKKPKVEEKTPEFGVWVGNLAFSTSAENIQKFFKECGTIVRMKCPAGLGARNKNKGFAYVFFSTPEEQAKAIELSEKQLDGRSLLIKDAKSFERKDGVAPPTAEERLESKKQKNPPCPTLFIGNLDYTITDKDLKERFEWAGKVRSVKVATFQDTGKCKGFGYVNYAELESAVKAVRAPDKHVINDRKIRVEYATEDAYRRSMPWLKGPPPKKNGGNSIAVPSE